MSTKTIEENPTTQADVSGCRGMQMPSPVKEHAWLQRFVGEWEAEVEAAMDPSQPPMKTKGAESVRMLGEFWIVSEGRNTEFPYEFRLTLGYDPQKKKYVGTWVDSMLSHLWLYEGTVDPTGKILTLETEGPAPMGQGRFSKFREVTEFKSKDHRVFTSSRLGEDGKWTTQMTVNSRRKK